MLCIVYDQLYFYHSLLPYYILNSCKGVIIMILLAQDLLNSSIMCVTDSLMDFSSSICNGLEPLWQLTVITYSEKLDIRFIMHDNCLLNSLKAENKEYSNLSGPHSSCLPLDIVVLNVVTLDYIYSQ